MRHPNSDFDFFFVKPKGQPNEQKLSARLARLARLGIPTIFLHLHLSQSWVLRGAYELLKGGGGVPEKNQFHLYRIAKSVARHT